MFISGLAGILAATGRDLNATTVLVTGRTVFDFLANKGYKVSSPWPSDQTIAVGCLIGRRSFDDHDAEYRAKPVYRLYAV